MLNALQHQESMDIQNNSDISSDKTTIANDDDDACDDTVSSMHTYQDILDTLPGLLTRLDLESSRRQPLQSSSIDYEGKKPLDREDTLLLWKKFQTSIQRSLENMKEQETLLHSSKMEFIQERNLLMDAQKQVRTELALLRDMRDTQSETNRDTPQSDEKIETHDTFNEHDDGDKITKTDNDCVNTSDADDDGGGGGALGYTMNRFSSMFYPLYLIFGYGSSDTDTNNNNNDNNKSTNETKQKRDAKDDTFPDFVHIESPKHQDINVSSRDIEHQAPVSLEAPSPPQLPLQYKEGDNDTQEWMYSILDDMKQSGILSNKTSFIVNIETLEKAKKSLKPVTERVLKPIALDDKSAGMTFSQVLRSKRASLHSIMDNPNSHYDSDSGGGGGAVSLSSSPLELLCFEKLRERRHSLWTSDDEKEEEEDGDTYDYSASDDDIFSRNDDDNINIDDDDDDDDHYPLYDIEIQPPVYDMDHLEMVSRIDDFDVPPRQALLVDYSSEDALEIIESILRNNEYTYTSNDIINTKTSVMDILDKEDQQHQQEEEEEEEEEEDFWDIDNIAF